METIGQLVSNDYRKAEIFKKYGIDFCCGGKKTLEKACTERGLEKSLIENELEKLGETTLLPSQNYNQWDLGFLVDYIVNTHHAYVLKSVPQIFEYTQKIANVHGDRHPELLKIASVFLSVSDELNRHMCKEEQVLFPYIKEMVKASSKNEKMALPPFGTIQNPIRMMEMEHDGAGNLIAELKELTSNYTPPANACGSYKLAFSMLRDFEADLFQHIHLENNILFPKSILLENQMLG